MKFNKWLLFLLALVLVLASGIGTAMAYFTTYVNAKGGYVIHLEDKTEIIEDVSSWTKHVSILNKEGSSPVFVRVKALAVDPIKLEFRGEGWVLGEGDYYYFQSPVEGGKTTEPELQIHIGPVDEDAKPGEDFNVIVVYESVPAVYTKDGDPDLAAAWAAGPITIITEGTGDAA